MTQSNRTLLSAGAMLLSSTLAVFAQQAPAPGKTANPNPFNGNEQAIMDGRDIFNRSCTVCHGKDGTEGDRGPALATPGRRYLRTSDSEIFEAIRNGIPGTQMPRAGLNETDAWKVATYLHGLRGTAIDAPAAGNIEHGEQVFWDKGGCGACHMLHGKGGLVGPDLSNIAALRKVNSIRDALTKAQHSVSTDGGRHDSALAPLSSYLSLRVTTRDGRTITGVLRNQDSFTLQMLGTDNVLHVFNRDELREVVYEPKSLMPTDYDQRLTPDEFQDLLAFLSRQGHVAPAPRPRAEQVIQ
jgi:cytochrome c oxidase cbb3-type subunit III